MRSTLSIFILLWLTSCGWVNYLSIETQNPAEITFPEQVKTILIVNNALPQPADAGHLFSEYGIRQDTIKAHADSALFEACKALGEAIIEKGTFEDVLLYNQPIRQDNDYLKDQRLTPQQVKQLCFENGAQAIISLDRLLFYSYKKITAYPERYVGGSIDLKMGGVFRAYIPEREKALATILVQDSIYWYEEALSRAHLDRILPTPDETLKEGARYLGSKLYPNFVPFWMNETRWYYNGFSSKWKEASAYAAQNRWEVARSHWNDLYEKSGSWSMKAKAASNIALAYEIESNLKMAHEWATKSWELFFQNKGEEDQNTKQQKAYVDALATRIRFDAKLDAQFGQE